MKNKVCRVCGVPLIVGENVTQYRIDHSQYLCRKCRRTYDHEHQLAYIHRLGRRSSMSENRECTAYLGVHVAEHVLSHIFKNVKRMPYGNPGYDFVCNKGYLVDAKASCRHHTNSPNRADNWQFIINKNPIAQYFLCLAFDSRDDMNPEHIWLIPAGDINDKIGVTISESRLAKWAQYEQPIDRVITCCDTMRNPVEPKPLYAAEYHIIL